LDEEVAAAVVLLKLEGCAVFGGGFCEDDAGFHVGLLLAT
jgi:hypothetical protein